MFGWHHQLNGHEFEQTPGDGEGQGSLVATVHGVTGSWTQLSNSTTTTMRQILPDTGVEWCTHSTVEQVEA